MQRRHSLASALSGALALSVGYALGVAALHDSTVEPAAWTALYLLCLAAGPWLWHRLQLRAGRWLAVAAYCALIALIFFGANGALDALNGVHRAKVQVADSLGGLELWFVLCPGGTATALGGALSSFVAGRWTAR